MTALELDTPRFGPLTVAAEQLVAFPRGVIGLPDCRRFVRLPFADPLVPFEWFQCVEDVTMAFLVTDPARFFPDYVVTVSPDALADIELTGEADGDVRCIVTVADRLADMTANLVGPLLVNRVRRLGTQVVLTDGRYATKHRLFPEPPAHVGAESPA